RHGEGEGAVPERRRRTLPEPVRQRAPAPRHEAQRHARPGCGGQARDEGRPRLRGGGEGDRRGAGRPGRGPPRERHLDLRGDLARRHRGDRRRGLAARRHDGDPARTGTGVGRTGTFVSLSRPFIVRPVATSLLMVAILLAGALGYRKLPVSALPQVDYPTIQVVTFYPGANPAVMASTVTAPLERQFGQMPGLAQM